MAIFDRELWIRLWVSHLVGGDRDRDRDFVLVLSSLNLMRQNSEIGR